MLGYLEKNKNSFDNFNQIAKKIEKDYNETTKKVMRLAAEYL